MAYDHPLVKGIAQTVEGVALDQLPDGVLLQRLAGKDRRVGEDEVPRLQRVGQRLQKGKLRPEVFGQQALEGCEILNPGGECCAECTCTYFVYAGEKAKAMGYIPAILKDEEVTEDEVITRMCEFRPRSFGNKLGTK